MQRESDANEMRIKPGAAALLKGFDCVLRAVASGEDIEMLGDGADASEQRDLIPPEAVRIAAAIPTLVKASNGLGSEWTHAQFGDNGGAAVVAKTDDLAVVLVQHESGRKHSANLCAGSRKDILPKQFECRTI